jgi:hypothetical protein
VRVWQPELRQRFGRNGVPTKYQVPAGPAGRVRTLRFSTARIRSCRQVTPTRKQLHEMEFVASGGMPPTPALFGEYEVGRTRLEAGLGHLTAPFRDGMPQGGTQLEQKWRRDCNAGDPGAYEPYFYEDEANCHDRRNRKAFDSTDVRKFPPTILGLDSPGMLYPVVQPEKTLGEYA